MKADTADLIIQILQLLADQSHDYSVKIKVMEKLLERDHHLKADYQQRLDRMWNDQAIVANRALTADTLAMLRAKLLQDQ
jgi:hypothetical protein